MRLRNIMRECERNTIILFLRDNRGRRDKTAKALGITRKCLWEKMKRLHITDEHWQMPKPVTPQVRA